MRGNDLAPQCASSIVLALDAATGWGTLLYVTRPVWEFAYERHQGGAPNNALYQLLHGLHRKHAVDERCTGTHLCRPRSAAPDVAGHPSPISLEDAGGRGSGRSSTEAPFTSRVAIGERRLLLVRFVRPRLHGAEAVRSGSRIAASANEWERQPDVVPLEHVRSFLESDLQYVSLQLDGATYGGWYRLLLDGQMELLALANMRTERRPEHDPIGQARAMLADFIRCARRND